MSSSGVAESSGPPSPNAFVDPLQPAHFGIDERGYFCEVHSAPAPLGGMLLDRAQREFSNLEALQSHGVPCMTPFAVVRYDGHAGFNGGQLGASVTLGTTLEPYRLDLLLEDDADLSEHQRAFRDKMLAGLGLETPLDGRSLLDALRHCSFEIGRLLQGFGAAGLYRHSGDWSNFAYCTQTRRLLFTDVDSSRPLAELTAESRTLQVLRDLAGTAHKLVDAVYFPAILSRVGTHQLLAENPLRALFAGFFSGCSDAAVRHHADAVWHYVMPHVLLMHRHSDTWKQPDSWALRQTYKVDRNLFYALVIAHGAVIFSQSEVAQSLGLPVIETDDLLHRATGLIGRASTAFVAASLR